MATSISWPPIGGASYSIPAAGEVGWPALSNFLIALADAQGTESQKVATRTATSTPVTVTSATDCVVIVALSVPGASTVNLPAGVAGQYFVIIDGNGDATTNNITINPNGTETINGAASLVISSDNDAVVLVFHGTNWSVQSQYTTTFTGSIARSQILPATPDYVLINDNTGLLSEEQYLSQVRGGMGENVAAFSGVVKAVAGDFSASAIVNADIDASAAIDATKIADGSVSSTEFQYLDGVTSDIQTQLNAKLDGPTLGIGEGGTGQTTQTAAFDALAPTTTKGDLIVHNGTDNIRLPVGADGTVLTADSAQASGFTFTAPLTNPMTTEGDIIYGGVGGAANRLALGTAGQFFIAGASIPGWGNTITSWTLTGGSAANLSAWVASNVMRLRGGTSGFAIDNTSAAAIASATDAGAWTLGPAGGLGGTVPGLTVQGGNSVGGSNAADAAIKLGNNASYGGAIQFSDSSATTLYIDSLINSDSSKIQFRTKTAATAVLVGDVIGSGAWTLGPSSGLTTKHLIQNSAGSTDRVVSIQNTNIAGKSGIDFLTQNGTLTGTVTAATGNATGMDYETVLGDTNFRAGGTSVGSYTQTGAWMFGTAGTEPNHAINGSFDQTRTITSGTGTIQRFNDGSSDTCGSIVINATANSTAYNTSSDARLKHSPQEFDGLSLVTKMISRKYERISDPGVPEYGFYAQELYQIYPQAVTVGGENPKSEPWQVDYSKVVPLLVKSIQELKAEIDDLKAKLAAIS